MIIAAIGCAFAGLCYSEFSCMIPVAGSAYTYAYATLGEWIAWIIGWDLVIEYAIGSATVSISWSAYMVSLLHAFHINLPVQWIAGPFEMVELPDGTMAQGYANIPAVVHRLSGVHAAYGRHQGIRADQCGDRRHQAGRCPGVHRRGLVLHRSRELQALPASEHRRVRLLRHQRPDDGRGYHLLRLHRLRRGLHSRAGVPESAKRHADRHYRFTGGVHRPVSSFRTGADRPRPLHEARRRGARIAGHRPNPACLDQ